MSSSAARIAFLVSALLIASACTADPQAADDTSPASASTAAAQTNTTPTNAATNPSSVTGPSASTSTALSSTAPAPSVSGTPAGSVSNSLPAPRTTRVPPPATGAVTQTALTSAPASVPPVTVPLSSSAVFSSGVSAKIAKLSATVVKAQGPGETAGPALEVSIVVTNGTTRALELTNVVVNLFDSDRRPCPIVESAGERLPAGVLQPGESRTGSVIFRIESDKRSPVHLEVIYAGGAQLGVFTGVAPQ